jgi:hypothetical protein
MTEDFDLSPPTERIAIRPDVLGAELRRCVLESVSEQVGQVEWMESSTPSGRRWWVLKKTKSVGHVWPTPNVPNGGRGVPADAKWSTPTCAYNQRGKKVQIQLDQAVKQWKKKSSWPTPMSMDHWMTNNPRKDGGQRQLPNAVAEEEGKKNFRLNADWVCQLMGCPDNWLDVK